MPLFSRRPRTAPGRSQDALEALPNTPPVVYEKNVRLFAELFGDPQVHSARWFVIAVILLVCNIVQTGLIMTMLPLKRAVPYMVETTDSGVVARAIEATQYKPTTAMVKAGVVRWAEQMMTLDPHLTRDYQKAAVQLLRGKAVAEHTDFLRTTDPFGRLLATPSLVRTVQVNSVDASKDGLVFVFLTTTERIKGEPDVKRWRLTIHYTLIPPESERELLANPVGLAITHFEIAQDLA